MSLVLLHFLFWSLNFLNHSSTEDVLENSQKGCKSEKVEVFTCKGMWCGMEEGQLPCGSSHSNSCMPVVNVLYHELHNFCFQLLLMVLVLSTTLKSPFQFPWGLEYITSLITYITLDIGQSEEEPACTVLCEQPGLSQQDWAQGFTEVSIGAEICLDGFVFCQLRAQAEATVCAMTVGVCHELEPVTWFLWGKDKLETSNFELERFSHQGWLLRGVYTTAVE